MILTSLVIIVISHFRVTRSSPKTRFDHERRYRARALSNITSKIHEFLFLWSFLKNGTNVHGFSMRGSKSSTSGGLWRTEFLDFDDVSLCILSRVSICYQWVISDEHVVTKILHLAENQIIKLSVILFQINVIRITISTIYQIAISQNLCYHPGLSERGSCPGPRTRPW